MKTITTIIAIIAVLVVIGGAYVYLGHMSSGVSTTTVAGGNTSANNGKVVYTMSDAAASSVSSVNVQVRSVQMQSSANGQWYTAAVAGSGNYQLHGQTSYSFIGNATVPAGNYDAIQMNVSSVTATYANGTTQAVAMPNSTVRVSGTFNVQSTASGSSTNWVTFNINSGQSLHTTSSGKLAIYPVVEVIAWSGAQLTTGTNNTVDVQNAGQVTADVNAGMNINGTMKTNFVLSQTTNIVVNANGTLGIGVG
jgi:hypothetical protein